MCDDFHCMLVISFYHFCSHVNGTNICHAQTTKICKLFISEKKKITFVLIFLFLLHIFPAYVFVAKMQCYFGQVWWKEGNPLDSVYFAFWNTSKLFFRCFVCWFFVGFYFLIGIENPIMYLFHLLALLWKWDNFLKFTGLRLYCVTSDF